MIRLENYQSLNDDRRHLLTLLAFWSEPADAEWLSELSQDAGGHRLLIEKVKKNLSFFNNNGWISLVSKNRQTWFLDGPIERAVYQEMLKEGDARDWWPRTEVAGEAPARDLFPELHRESGGSRRTRPSLHMLISEGIRLAATGSFENASPELRELLRREISNPAGYCIAYCAVVRFGEEPPFHLSKTDPFFRILPAWMTMCFMCGRSFVGILGEIHRLFGEGVKFNEPILNNYWSLCVWAGRGDWVVAPDERSENEVFSACQHALSGDFKIADALFKMGEDDILPTGDDPDRDYENVALRFLMAMAAAVAKPEKIAKRRPGELMYFYYPGWTHDGGFFSEGCYRKNVERICQWAGGEWSRIGEAEGGILQKVNLEGEQIPVTALLAAWNYHEMKGAREPWRETAEKLWKKAKELDALGWASYANLLSTLLTGGYDRAAEGEYLRDLDGRSVHFLQRLDPAPAWKGVLTALEKSIPKRKKQESEAESPRFIWYLSLRRDGPKGCFSIQQITPAVRPAGARTTGEDDEVLDGYDLEKKRYRDLMSDRDSLIAARRYGRTGVYSRAVNWTEMMKHLCGAPNLVRRDLTSDWVTNDWKRAKEMTLESRPCEMRTTAGEDGGVVLEAPEWALENKGDWILREIGEGHFAYVELSGATKKILDVFGRFGTNGRIVIPCEGMSAAEPLIERLATVMPLAEPTKGAKDLKRVQAASDLRVRLEYREGALVVRAVILPLPENPNLTLDPVRGPTEKVIVGAVTSFVLVRNIMAEADAFESVCAALEKFESAFDYKSTWRFEYLADALEALAKLKALGERAPLEWINDRRLSVSSVPKSGVKLTSQRTADDWFRVDGTFELDDGRVLSMVALLEAARTRRGNYVRVSDGDYVALTSSMARELDALNAAGRRKGDGVEIVKAAIPMLDGVFGGGDDAIDLPDAMAVTAEEIRTAFSKRPSVPRTLNAELRPYQEDGYRWLSRLAACGFGSCLADDMGLGKTIQVIALLLERAAKGASLVFAPSSVCGNWRRELERFAPSLRPVMALEETEDLSSVRAGDVVIASYGYLLFHEDDFASVTWNGLVLDEAQAIKNDASKRAKAVKRLHAKFRVAATGTPVENRLGELWSLFDFLNPGLLGPAASFAQRFTVDGKAVPELKRLVKPLILRRLKGDVLEDLPEKTEITIPVLLSKSERTAYEACRQQALASLAAKAESDGAANRMSILAELTRLRRFCCHPSLVLPGADVPSAKMEALVDLLEGLRDGHHRALVFSQFTDYLAIVRKMLEGHGWSHLYLDGATPTLEREKLVNRFQEGEGDFFLISLKAGGTGLNLTAANYVILLDPWWNPAVENQAADRAHRIGQTNPVTVYRLIASDTVEARVIELHKEKQAIAEDILEGTSSTSLSPAQLMKLFS